MPIGQQGGLIPHSLVAAAGANATLVQAQPTHLFSYTITNYSGNPLLVRFFDTAVASTSGYGPDTPKFTVGLPANWETNMSVAGQPQSAGIQFNNGLAYQLSASVNNVSDNSGVGAGNISISLSYK